MPSAKLGPDGTPPQPVVKRSVTIDGHRTSVSVEGPFWQAVRDIAAERGLRVAELLAEIDHARRPGSNLSSSIRIYALDWYRKKRGSPAAPR
jgi:predicted DNA-binding ribbon-helix-helix protein